MSERREFVTLARSPGANISMLARRYGISRKTGYKWLARAKQEGVDGLADRSRRPLHSPARTPVETEARVLALREERRWGGRKLSRRLSDEGVAPVPAPSTITAILRWSGRLDPDRRPRRDWQRFEAAAPNQLWQMDFKGHFAVGSKRCHPLTVLDDHSRFNLCLAACANELGETVQAQLTRVFERYGLPERILADNGPPWGSSGQGEHTRFTAWLIRLGVSVSHGRPYHPQTQGKDERFHRTLRYEVIDRRPWHDFEEVQPVFDVYQGVYNFERPHEALGLEVPGSRYRPSPRSLLAALPPVEYAAGDEVRKVRDNGRIKLEGRLIAVGKAFIGEPVAVRPAGDGVWEIYYCHQPIARLDLHDAAEEV